MGKITEWMKAQFTPSVSITTPNIPSIQTMDEVNPQIVNRPTEPMVPFQQSAIRAAGSDPLQPIVKDITFDLMIANGFEYNTDSAIDVYISIDDHTLQVAKDIVKKKLQLSFEDDGTQHELECMIPINKLYIIGSLFCNVVITGFKAKDFLEATTKGQVEYHVQTAFSSSDTLVLNQKIGYGCPFADEIEDEFDIEINLKTPFILLPDGTKVELEPLLTGTEVTTTEPIPFGHYKGNEYMNGSQSIMLYIPCTMTVSLVGQGS